MQPCVFSKHIEPISDLEKLGLTWFMSKSEGTWVHSEFDVTNYIPHISTKNQWNANQFVTSNQEWTHVPSHLVMKQITKKNNQIKNAMRFLQGKDAFYQKKYSAFCS